MNWFSLYYEALTKTGFFGVILFLVTIIGLFIFILPFMYVSNYNWLNKNIKSKITTTVYVIFITFFTMVVLNVVISELPIDFFNKHKNTIQLSYFMLGMLPFIIMPITNLKYCKFWNKDYDKL
jgi:hypothetical protein